MEQREHTLQSTTVFAGRLLTVVCDTVQLPDGSQSSREMVRHRGAVGVAAVDKAGGIWLVRQFRYAAGRELLEIPAGTREAGETPRATAERELREELGCTARCWTQLAQFYTSPGFSDELLTLYLAEDLEFQTDTESLGVEGEFLRRERWPLDRALEAALQGEFQDAKTLVGILLAAARLGVKGGRGA